jgi:hypothetical protein
MPTTPELKNRFNSAFSKIMKHATPELQKKWGGIIDWKDNKQYPEIAPEIIKELPPGAKAAYVTLLNKLSRGVI